MKLNLGFPVFPPPLLLIITVVANVISIHKASIVYQAVLLHDYINVYRLLLLLN